jgi:hypothetical protein
MATLIFNIKSVGWNIIYNVVAEVYCNPSHFVPDIISLGFVGG